MIEKEIQTNFSSSVHFSVLGKAETKELEGVPKEELTTAIKELVAKKTKIPANKVFVLDQVHGDKFYNTKDLVNEVVDGDALYTTKPDEVLVVKTADCMPIFFWSEKEKLIGIIHSGWKGTELGISEKLFSHLKQQGHSLDSIHVYLGPCARKKNYEVAGDLFEKFKAYSPEAIEPKGNQKYSLGIDIVLKKRFLENQIPIQFSDSGICTIENPDYHSHRCKDMGRNLNIIYMSE
ncbi:MAG: polyphenol oxidase family protein [Leptospiraceae bacterium]|nr:polyphenol oxidase family protein [Leptospiraceae bacterium]